MASLTEMGNVAGPASCSVGQYRDIWLRKPSLRAVYRDYHERIMASCLPGRTLDIGSGSGHFREIAPNVVSVDIQAAAWLDAVADAHALPFADASFANVVLLDVLHHLRRPRTFLGEALRVLEPGGRLVLLEPAITPFSWLVLKLFHEEPVNLGTDPLADADQTGPRPEDANQAIPHLLFVRHRRRLEAMFPDLRLLHVSRLSLAAYLLSGGFRPWSLIPAAFVGPLLRAEDAVLPLFGPWAAFRLFVVAERNP